MRFAWPWFPVFFSSMCALANDSYIGLSRLLQAQLMPYQVGVESAFLEQIRMGSHLDDRAGIDRTMIRSASRTVDNRCANAIAPSRYLRTTSPSRCKWHQSAGLGQRVAENRAASAPAKKSRASSALHGTRSEDQDSAR